MRDGWETVRVSDVATVVGGGTPKSGVETYWGGDVPWLTPKDLSQKPARYTSSGERSITEAGLKASGARLLPAGSVLLTSRAPVGYVTVASTPIATNQGFKSLVLKDGQVPEFWYYLLGHSTEFLRAHSGGSTFAELSGSALKTLEFTIPPVLQQRRIVNLIGAVDDAIEAADDAADASDFLWWHLAAAMEEAVRSVKTVALGVIADISGGLTKNKKDFEGDDLVEVPYLRVANVHRRYLNLHDVALIKTTASKAESLRLLPGDVLLNEGGDRDKLGRGAVWEGQIEGCIHQNHVFRARLRRADYVPAFVSAWSNSFGQRWFETFGTQTTGIASINKATLSRFPVPELPLVEQVKWAELLGQTLTQHDLQRRVSESLRVLRSELLSALLSSGYTIPESYDDLIGA